MHRRNRRFPKQSFQKYQNTVCPSSVTVLHLYGIWCWQFFRNLPLQCTFYPVQRNHRESTQHYAMTAELTYEKTRCLLIPCTALYSGVSTWAPGTQPGEPQKYYHSVTAPSKQVCEKLLILICHPVIWQDPEEWMPAINSLPGGGAHPQLTFLPVLP